MEDEEELNFNEDILCPHGKPKCQTSSVSVQHIINILLTIFHAQRLGPDVEGMAEQWLSELAVT